MTMTLISTVTVSGTTTQIATFSTIPQDGTDLVLLVNQRNDNGNWVDLYVRFNSSALNYSGRELYGSGSTVVSRQSPTSTNAYIGIQPGLSQTANTFGNIQMYIPNYTSGNNKTYSLDYVSENNATENYLGIFAGLWQNTAAITSLSVITEGASRFFVPNSTFSLYKITKGSTPGVVVS